MPAPLWIAALLTPCPPPLMVLNEPETSLHPDLLPALARLIIKAAEQTQVWVVSHANRLIAALGKNPACHFIALELYLRVNIKNHDAIRFYERSGLHRAGHLEYRVNYYDEANET